ncbi:hypothetical protein QYF36_014580 [Acer negundo]|nr:hypothetical protein QYF36_014580 [Acer negundo]
MLLLEKEHKQFHDKEMEGLRTFYPGNMGEDMLERMVFKPWLELWLKHLEWYIKAVSDYSLPLQYPLSPPLVPLSTSRGRRRVHIFHYGFIFKFTEIWSKDNVPLIDFVLDPRLKASKCSRSRECDPEVCGTRADRADKDKGLAVAKETLKDRVTQLDVKKSRAVFMGPQQSRWRYPKRDGDELGQIEVRNLLWR